MYFLMLLFTASQPTLVSKVPFPLLQPSHTQKPVERRNMQYKFYSDDMAYLTWDQYQIHEDGTKYQHSKEIRLMEKQGGKWKIAFVAAFWDYKNFVPVKELQP